MEIITIENKELRRVLKKNAALCIPTMNKVTKQLHWDEFLLNFVKNMEKKLSELPSALAIAANQVWEHDTNPPRVFVMKLTDKIEVFINPIVKGTGKQIKELESCLSFPGRAKLKKRHKNATILYQHIDDLKNQFALKVTGIEARAVQHEIDHLQGITLFTLKP